MHWLHIEKEDSSGASYLIHIFSHNVKSGERSVHGLNLKPTDWRGEFRGVGVFIVRNKAAIYAFLGKAGEEERSQIRAQDLLYEEYEVEDDTYTIKNV
jgi:hypothetical protein